MKDVFSNILPKHLGFRDYLNFGLSCKEYYSLLDIPKKRDATQKRITELFPPNIIDMIGKNRLLMASEVPWDQKWLGPTDYIDSMRPKDFPDNYFIYYGIDRYTRPFIFLKTRVTKSYPIENKESKITMISLFQRYSDSKTFVGVDHTASGEILLQHRTRIDDELEPRIKTFLETGRLEKDDTVMEIFY